MPTYFATFPGGRLANGFRPDYQRAKPGMATPCAANSNHLMRARTSEIRRSMAANDISSAEVPLGSVTLIWPPFIDARPRRNSKSDFKTWRSWAAMVLTLTGGGFRQRIDVAGVSPALAVERRDLDNL